MKRESLRWFGFLYDPGNKPLSRPGVYRIVHLSSKRNYIGASKNVAGRLIGHVKTAHSEIHRAIRRDPTNFKIQPLYYTLSCSTLEELPSVESSMMWAYKGHTHGYNTRRVTSRNMHASDANERRIASIKRTMSTPEFKKARGDKMREIHSRKDVKEKHRASVTAANANPATKELIAASKRGRIWITDGVETKQVTASGPFPAGWIRGRGKLAPRSR